MQVYKIFSKCEPNQIYIGSTSVSLKQRFRCHKRFHDYGEDMTPKWRIELLETRETKPEALVCERDWIRLCRNEGWEVLNKYNPCRITREENPFLFSQRAKKEYEKNKESIKKRVLKYYHKNKEHIGRPVNCPHCDIIIRADNLGKHIHKKH